MTPERDTGGVRRVVLGTPSAGELLDLVADEPGDADEALLDEALDSLERPVRRVPTADQERARVGDAVIVELPQDTAEAAARLIVEDVEPDPRARNRLRNKLRSKLRTARRRSRRTS